MDSMGRGIFVVDLSNGHKLFEATYGMMTWTETRRRM